MKITIGLLLATFLLAYNNHMAMAQDETPSVRSILVTINTVTIKVYRGSQFFGADVNFNILANGKKICELSNKKIIEFQIPAGNIVLNAERSGVEDLKKTTGITLETKVGETYYVRCDVKSSITRTSLKMSEVTKSTADRDMIDLTKDNC